MEFIRGSTFQLEGNFQDDGLSTDTTAWSVTGLISQAGTNIPFDTIIPTLIDASTGLWKFTNAASSTSNWPVGKARIDIKVVTQFGEIMNSAPLYFRVIDTPLE